MLTDQFPRVGRCIYCPNPDGLELSEEHIVPLGLGGKWKLPDASCPNCRNITSAFESHVLDNMMGAARTHMGIRRRKPKGPIKMISAVVGEPKASKIVKMPLRDHPGSLLMFLFGVPGIMLNLPPKPILRGRPIAVNILPDFQERANRSSGAWINVKGFTEEPFGRMLAKIAHAFTVGSVGLENFRPLLIDAILGEPPRNLSSFIGTEFLAEPPVRDMHQLFLVREKRGDGREFYIVRIRLFSNYGTPTYRVVSGEVL